MPFPPRRRAERLIAGGRVVIAASSLLALWRDPSEPAKYAAIAYGLLAAYLAYSSLLALYTWRAPRTSRWGALTEHVFDLLFFSTFTYFTSGPASPFIAYFVFSLVCATLRWRWRGTLWTAVASLAAFLGFGYYFAEVLRDPSFQLNDWVIRGVYMAVVAFLLGYLGWHQERTRAELALLADWPHLTAGDPDRVLGELLAHAARVHPGADLVLAWSVRDRPRLSLASRAGVLPSGGLGLSLDELVHDELAQGGFLLARRDRTAEVLTHHGGHFARWSGDQPLHPKLAARLGGRSLLSAVWHGELVRLRMFVVDPIAATADELVLAEITAALAGARIEGLELIDRMRAGAATEERVRLARDLHDGALQSWTGFGLRLAAARRLLPESAGAATESLEELQRLVSLEQRDLRFFIQDLEPPGHEARGFDLAQRLAELIQRAEHEWQLRVDLDAAPVDDDLPDVTERDLYFLVREAIVNAVRHGGARRISVRLTRPDEDRLALTVADDGSGFPLRGRFDHDELARLDAGPRSLRHRISSRGGRLGLESSDQGARLEIELPVGKESAA